MTRGHSQYFERLWILVTGSLEKNSASPSTLVEFFKKSGLDRKMLRDVGHFDNCERCEASEIQS